MTESRIPSPGHPKVIAAPPPGPAPIGASAGTRPGTARAWQRRRRPRGKGSAARGSLPLALLVPSAAAAPPPPVRPSAAAVPLGSGRLRGSSQEAAAAACRGRAAWVRGQPGRPCQPLPAPGGLAQLDAGPCPLAWGSRSRGMLRRAVPSLCHFSLWMKNSTAGSSHPSQAEMSRAVQARRLEGIDKNIWVEFVKLAATYSKVNLGQGFPDFPPPDFLKEAFMRALSGEDQMLHQYTRAFGHPPLVKVLAQFFGKLLGRELDPMTNVMVTVGAYQALFCCFQAFVEEGDEVVIIEPFFDCYEPMVRMAGGTPVFVPLRPRAPEAGRLMSSADWQLDPAELASKFSSRTKAIVLNSPNNPLGKVFGRRELELVAALCERHGALCISDEVYEWLVYDGRQHLRIASLPGMWERTVTVGSSGKTFSVTGWKVGWALGPDRLLQHLRTVHQNSVYHCATAAQEAVAQGFQRELELYGKAESYFVQLPRELQQKRDWLVQSLAAVGMKPIVPEGTYFLVADISQFKSDIPEDPSSEEPYDSRFAKWMVKNKGLAAIPLSAFFCDAHKGSYSHFLRFCFAKEEATLKAANNILQAWKQEKSSP